MSTFARLNRIVDNFVENIQKDIEKLEQEVKFLSKQEEIVVFLKNEVHTVQNELQSFSDRYL